MKATTLIEGLQIIARTQPDAEVDAQHDQLYIGEHNAEAMTDGERAKLDELGFFEDHDSWSCFT